MNTLLLEQLHITIAASSTLPQTEELFAGANLLIATRKDAASLKNHLKNYPNDLLVVSASAKEFSWLVFQLKEIYADEIDAMNKFQFYSLIGRTILKGIEQQKNTSAIIKAVLHQCENWCDQLSKQPYIPKRKKRQ